MTSPPRRAILALGEALAIMVADDGRPLTHATAFRRDVAGAELNVAIGLARLGHEVEFAGQTGHDTPGEWIRRTLRAEGVGIRWLREDPDRPTALLVRDVARGPRTAEVQYYRRDSAGSRLALLPDPAELVRGFGTLFVSGITAMLSPSAAAYVDGAMDAASTAGVRIVFDPNIRLRVAGIEEWRRRMPPLLARAQTILIGERELADLGYAAPAQLLGEVTNEVVVRRGRAGAEAHAIGEHVEASAIDVNVIDVVGAGDAFTAAWISARSRGEDRATAVRMATTAAGLAVAAPADTVGLPTWRELLDCMNGDIDIAR